MKNEMKKIILNLKNYLKINFNFSNLKKNKSDSELSLLSHDPDSLLDFIDIIQDNFYKKYKVFPYKLFDYHAKKIQRMFKNFKNNKLKTV